MIFSYCHHGTKNVVQNESLFQKTFVLPWDGMLEDICSSINMTFVIHFCNTHRGAMGCNMSAWGCPGALGIIKHYGIAWSGGRAKYQFF